MAAPTCRIAVIGGAGTIGRRIVGEAAYRGHRVRLVVRDASRVVQNDDRLDVVECDVLDRRLADHLHAQDVVVSAVGVARAEEPDGGFYLRAAESLVESLRSLADPSPRLLVVGGVGSLMDESGELMLRRVPADRRPEHLAQKAALDFFRTVSDIAWTYLSPPARIVPGERTGVYRTGIDRLVVDGNGESWVSLEDYAVALIDEAETPRHIRTRFTVAY